MSFAGIVRGARRVLKRFRECGTLHRVLRWVPGIPRDAGVPILLNISSQNSYAIFCFIKRGLNSAMRPAGAMVQPRFVVAAGPREAGGSWPKQRQPRTPAAQPAEAPPRPALQEVSQCMLLEREVEVQYRARMRKALQDKVNAAADSLLSQSLTCARCSQPMKRHDTETVSRSEEHTSELQSPCNLVCR